VSKKTLELLAKDVLRRGVTSSLDDLAQITDAHLEELDLSSMTQLEQINLQAITLAKSGDIQAIKLVHERLAGKPHQSMEVKHSMDPHADKSKDDLLKMMGEDPSEIP
jgi:hypothetical protein